MGARPPLNFKKINLFFLCSSCGIKSRIFLFKAVNSSSSVNQLLLARKKRMALGNIFPP